MNRTKEMYDLMESFEKAQRYGNFQKENKDLWEKKLYYQNGKVNDLFIAFMNGYSLAKCMAHQGWFN